MFSKDNEIREAEILNTKDTTLPSTYQFPLFLSNDSEIERDIQEIDLDSLTPLEALNKISEWKKKV